MMQAVTAPVFRSVAVGALMLALGAAASARKTNHRVHLALDTVWKLDSLYLSAWADGDDVQITIDGAPRPFTITERAWISDGCRWEGTETLVPTDEGHYAYTYEDHILECKPHARPCTPSHRTGIVTVYK
jgi:hypothetical protein